MPDYNYSIFYLYICLEKIKQRFLEILENS